MNLAGRSETAGIQAELDRELRNIVDPEAANAAAFADQEKRIEELSRLVDRYPDALEGHVALSTAFETARRYEEALEQFERIYPVYGPALLGSSIAWISRGRVVALSVARSTPPRVASTRSGGASRTSAQRGKRARNR